MPLIQTLLETFYRASRPLRCVDVVRLMHLQEEELSDPSVVDGYQIATVDQPTLERAIRNGNVAAQVGSPHHMNGGSRALVAAWRDETIVSFLWLAGGRVAGADNFSRAPHLGTAMGLPAGTTLIYNAWTDPAHRGHGLIAALVGYAIRHRVLDTTSLVASIDWTNEKSLRAFRRIGMKPLGSVARIGVGPVQLSVLPDLSALGLELAGDAPGWRWINDAEPTRRQSCTRSGDEAVDPRANGPAPVRAGQN